MLSKNLTTNVYHTLYSVKKGMSNSEQGPAK